MTYYEAWQNAEKNAEEAKQKAIAAKKNSNKSEYEFWLSIFEDESKKADEMFNKYMEIEYKPEVKEGTEQ